MVLRVETHRVDGELIIRLGKANRYGIGGRVFAFTIPELTTDLTDWHTQVEGFRNMLVGEGG